MLGRRNNSTGGLCSLESEQKAGPCDDIVSPELNIKRKVIARFAHREDYV